MKRQVTSLCKAFAKNLSANIKLSKIQIPKIIQSDGFLGRRLEPLMKVVLLLMKNVMIPLWLTESATDAGIHKNILGSGATTHW